MPRRDGQTDEQREWLLFKFSLFIAIFKLLAGSHRLNEAAAVLCFVSTEHVQLFLNKVVTLASTSSC